MVHLGPMPPWLATEYIVCTYVLALYQLCYIAAVENTTKYSKWMQVCRDIIKRHDPSGHWRLSFVGRIFLSKFKGVFDAEPGELPPPLPIARKLVPDTFIHRAPVFAPHKTPQRCLTHQRDHQ